LSAITQLQEMPDGRRTRRSRPDVLDKGRTTVWADGIAGSQLIVSRHASTFPSLAKDSVIMRNATYTASHRDAVGTRGLAEKIQHGSSNC